MWGRIVIRPFAFVGNAFMRSEMVYETAFITERINPFPTALRQSAESSARQPW
jgi:hypothetical protein